MTALLWSSRRSIALLSAFLLAYLVIALHHLDRIPPLYQDESWQASTAWKLATHGVFGSDMFAGFYRMDQRYYGFMPIHPLLQAAVFRVAGIGVVQVRVVSVLMGFLVLLLTYTLGRRLYDPSVGLVAVALLLLIRLTGVTRSQSSGILLLDTARIARYDIVVPVFGLLSLHAYWSWRGTCSHWQALLAGLLAGLAGLSHLYGAFWLIALGLLITWERAGWRSLAALSIGFLLPWSSYVLYVLGDLHSWAGQTQGYGPRFDLLNPRWYWQNLISEPHRYGPGLGSLTWSYLLRPGFWTALAALPLSALVLARLAIFDGDPRARLLLVPLLVFPTLFALLLSSKVTSYAVSFLPVAALTVAWGGVALWRRASVHASRIVHVTLLAALLAGSVEGVTRIMSMEAQAASTTRYATYMDRVRASIPAGSKILGLHDYWLGLYDFDYHAWVVPLWRSDPRYMARPVALPRALDDIAPDIVLIDVAMRDYLESAPPTDQTPTIIQDWMTDRGYRRVALVDDTTYGALEIYRRGVHE